MSKVDEVLTDIGSKYDEKNGIDNYEDDSPSYVSVVSYEVDGKKYRIRNTIGTDTKSKKGKRVDVRYNPKNPSEAVIKNDKSFLLLVGLMILFIFFGYLGLHS